MKQLQNKSFPFVAALLACSLFFANGCSTTPPPTKTTAGAGTGAGVGGILGGIIGHQSGSTAEGALLGAALGAAAGGLYGHSQEQKERREQESLAQERAHQQELARIRAEQAKLEVERTENLAVAEGMHISDREIQEAKARARSAEDRLRTLEAEKSQAIARKKALEEA